MKYILLAIITTLFFNSCFDKNGNNNITLKTLFHENGKLLEKNIDSSLILIDGSIKNKFINSIKTYTLDSIFFENNNPDKVVLNGSELVFDANFNFPQNKQAKYYAVFTAYHITECINYYLKLFDNKLNFNAQENYLDIEIYFGNALYLSNPKQFIYNPASKPSPTIVYHEIGHRAFWLIEEELKINLGGANNFIHLGLLEYFTASLANHPIIMDNIFPNTLIRNVGKKVTFPQNFYSVRSTIDLLYKEYNKYDNENWHKKYYDLYSAYGSVLDSIPDGHRSAMMIAHPLWELRNKIGSNKADSLIAKSILNLPEFIKKREEYLKIQEDIETQVKWYDLIYALIKTDEILYNGTNQQVIIQSFNDVGYNIESIAY